MSNTFQMLSRPPDPKVVEYLESVLARAKLGEVTGVLVLSYDGAGLAYHVAGLTDRYAISGWLFHALHKLQEE